MIVTFKYLVNISLHMRLDDYLEKLQNCQDERLKSEFGLSDNWYIFLNMDFNRFIDHLKESDNYSYLDARKQNDEVCYFFEDKSTVIELQIVNKIYDMTTTGCACETEIDKIESKRQLRDYNLTIVLQHPYRDRNIENVLNSRLMGNVVLNIGNFAIEKGIPLCMPQSIGFDYDKKDYSRIIYHEPNIPVPSKK